MDNIIYEKMGRRLVWHDEFDKGEIDNSKWSNEKLMNNADVVYDNSKRHQCIENNMLHLMVNVEDGRFSTSMSITTKHTMLFRYGYVEMRAKIPFRRGAWPSFWLKGETPYLRSKEGRNNWFPETDILEAFSSFDSVFANIHRWGSKNGESFHEMLPDNVKGQGRGYKFDTHEKAQDEFHIYGMLWDEHKMAFFVDDEKFFDVDIDETSVLVNDICGDMMGFHDPQYLIINNEIFSESCSWYPQNGILKTDDQMPIDYYVDYVRLYQNGGKEKLYLGEHFDL